MPGMNSGLNVSDPAVVAAFKAALVRQGIIALVIFGPNELPKIASQAGRALRDLRRIAEGAKNDLREGLGPEFSDFEIEDLNPKRFVQKHLFDDVNGDNGNSAARDTATAQATRTNGTLLAPGERAPYDPDAT